MVAHSSTVISSQALFREGSTELADILQRDSLWTAVHGKVKKISIRASLVKYGRFEKKGFSKNSLEKIMLSFDEL